MSNDPKANAEQMFQLFHVSKDLVLRFLPPACEEYHQGLLRLTNSERAKGIVVVEGSGHFIQIDRADAVSEEIQGLVTSLAKSQA